MARTFLEQAIVLLNEDSLSLEGRDYRAQQPWRTQEEPDPPALSVSSSVRHLNNLYAQALPSSLLIVRVHRVFQSPQLTAILFSPLAASTAIPEKGERPQCNADNALRCLRQSSAQTTAFCSSYNSIKRKGVQIEGIRRVEW